MESPELLLVDDNEHFRRSTAWLLEDAGLKVVEYGDGQHLLADLQQQTEVPGRPRCIVTDLRMPGMSGLELLDELSRLRTRLPVIMMTAHGDVPLAVEAMRRGAADFLEKPFTVEALMDSARQVIDSPGALPRNPRAARARLESLTPREQQVLELVCAGKYNKVIADRLGISIKTVELHRAKLVSKLGAKSVPDLVRLTLGYE